MLDAEHADLTSRGLGDIADADFGRKQGRPGTELTALPGCGHFLQEDEPERVGELIAEFFNSAPR
jgi:pimeloyl-ACP methyl ester carboxylesterase